MVTDLEGGIGIRKPNDWYLVSFGQLGFLKSRIGQLGGLYTVLSVAYPNVEWKAGALMSKGKAATQGRLDEHISKFFDEKPVLVRQT